MAAPTEPSVYEGTAGVWRNSTLLTHTTGNFMPKFRELIFTATPFLKSLALAAFGKKAAIGEASFGNVTKTSGKGILFNDGGYQFEFPIFTGQATSSIIGVLDNINPEYIDLSTSGAYSWKRMVIAMLMPEEYAQDNVGKAQLMSRLNNTMKTAQMTAIRDMNYSILGHSSAPTGAPTGLPDLVSHTQTATIGGIATTSTHWQNQLKTCTSVGGGGDLDRPIQLLRSMETLMLSIRSKSGSTNEQTLVGTQGAYQYYGRAAYADTLGTRGAEKVKDYYDASIPHLVYDSRPFIYDGAVTVPTGATASTECIYYLDYNEFGVCFKRVECFALKNWEAPRNHDKQRYHEALILSRFTPYVTNRRVQGVLYNLPANPDAS